MYIDTHCHLDYEDYKKDGKTIKNIIDEAVALNVKRFITISASPESLEKVVSIANNFKEVYFTLGVHPAYTEALGKDYLNIIKANIKHHKCLAIGEVGLDYHYQPFNKQHQRKLFIEQIYLAIEYNKPLVIHSRDAEEDVLSIINTFYKDLKAILVHSYTGPSDTLKEFIKLGAFVSFNGISTFKNAKNVKTLLELTPVDRILVETDSPYLAPIPHRGKTNYPKYIPIIVENIARQKNIDISIMEKQLEANTKIFFNI